MTVTLDDLLHHELDEFERARKERSVVATRERILTDNEKFGNGFMDEGAGGVWIVLRMSKTGKTGHVAHVYSNWQACEDYIHAKCAEHGLPLHRYTIQVWHAEDAYEPDGEEAAA